MAPQDLTAEDLALVVRAAQAAGLDAGKLEARNPWTFEGSVALALQAAVSDLDPAAAERLSEAAGVRLSLGAQAALAGLQDWSDSLLAELATKQPARHKQLQQEAADRMLEQSAMGAAFTARRAEAEKVAEANGWNPDVLAAQGHHLAATIAAERNERLQAEKRREQERDHAWLHNGRRR